MIPLTYLKILPGKHPITIISITIIIIIIIVVVVVVETNILPWSHAKQHWDKALSGFGAKRTLGQCKIIQLLPAGNTTARGPSC
jgi:hypothetical protein